jgi:hypothetical protein
MACKVKVNRHGFLAFRLYWDGHESWEGSGLKDTPKNRQRMEAHAVLISEEMERGTFDYLKRFPNGNKAHLFKPKVEEPQRLASITAYGLSEKNRPLCVRDLSVITAITFAYTYSRNLSIQRLQK